MRPFWIIAGWSLLAAAQGMAQTPAIEARPAFVAPSISPEDAKKLLAELEQEYEKRLAKLPPAEGKRLYGRNTATLDELIRERYENHSEARRQLVASIATAKDGTFGYGVLQDVVYLLKDCQERELLTWLLSNNCPTKMFFSQIECAMVIIRADKVSDGVLVLCDAYEQSQNDSSRKMLYTALERGFRFLRIKTATADDYVSEVRKWYLENREAYEPNHDYLDSAHFDYDYEREGMFVVKGTNAKRLEEQKRRGAQHAPPKAR